MKVRILVVVGLLLSVVAWQFRMRFPFDDTFITFRYAQHLAQGQGLVWNVGGPHTEGYTNFLFIVLLTPTFWLGIDPLVYAQVFNIAALLGSAILLYLLTELLVTREFHSERSSIALFAPLSFLVTPLVWINALSGMETTLFGFGVLFALYNFALGFYAANGQKQIRIAFAAAFLTALVRPEGALLGAIIWAVLFANRRERNETSTSFLLFCALPLLLYHIARFLYFGRIVPNSFMIKVVDANIHDPSLFHGIQYVRIFLTSTLALALLSLLALRAWRSWRVVWGLAIWCSAILFFYTLPFPSMGLYDRFLYAVEVVFFVLAAVGFHVLKERRSRVAVTVALASFILIHAACSWFSPRAAEARVSNDRTYHRYREIAQILREMPAHDSVSFAFADAGIIPFYSELPHLDAVGLNDNELARARSAEDILRLIALKHPDMIFIPVAIQGPDDDSCRRIYRYGHGFIGAHYILFTRDARFASYKTIVLLHVDLYDIAVLADMRSAHARDIEAAFHSRMSANGFILPPSCLD